MTKVTRRIAAIMMKNPPLKRRINDIFFHKLSFARRTTGAGMAIMQISVMMFMIRVGSM